MRDHPFRTGTEATPRSFTLDDVNFESGSARLTPSARQTVASLTGVLTAHPSARVRLEGHTDASGDEAANMRLSEQRAAAVKSALVDAGASAEGIEVTGHGSEQPVADNETDAGRARNRRTELVVVQR